MSHLGVLRGRATRGAASPTGVRALLLEARVDPAIIEAIASRNKLVIQLSSSDFAAMGWAHPGPSAAMWNNAVVDAILERSPDKAPGAIDPDGLLKSVFFGCLAISLIGC
ncbi:hypothetical protein Psi02_42650 [Planotetraspora silvatica]|uniref:Uncharacterized protein n=1 Tax=Planotetraspora silvatica TaxID=234614 RepID=A0A8J3XPY4_9ACTN|nr:hypothetical protein [Planotetraspora silvatica]GII47841.1 hypothetical protein Psi02_42650 [Planotetraspora silvatica]